MASKSETERTDDASPYGGTHFASCLGYTNSPEPGEGTWPLKRPHSFICRTRCLCDSTFQKKNRWECTTGPPYTGVSSGSPTCVPPLACATSRWRAPQSAIPRNRQSGRPTIVDDLGGRSGRLCGGLESSKSATSFSCFTATTDTHSTAAPHSREWRRGNAVWW
jgi:hypothetical protein